MLSEFGLANFKSYRDASLKFAPLTVLIGANGSGKSNAVEALWLISRLARGISLETLRVELRGERGPIRGRLNDLGYRRSPTVRLSCGTTHPEWDRYVIELQVGADNSPVVVGESLEGWSPVPLFRVTDTTGAGSLWVAYNNFARGGKKPIILCSNGMAVLGQLQTPARFGSGNKTAQRTIPEVVSATIRSLSNIMFLSPDLSEMRRYGSTVDPVLGPRGDNLSGALYNLCNDADRKSQMLGFVRELPEQDIRDIAFVKTPRTEVMVQLKETFGSDERVYDAVALSDGTLRVLAIAAAALSAEEGSLLVIEEIDNGVHPSRAGALLRRILDVARKRKVRVLMSTHNPALLDALPDETLGDVTFCYRDDEGASNLIRLQDLPDYPNLVARGPIGSLMTSGTIDRFVKNPISNDERVRQGLSWVSNLRVAAS